MMRAEVTGLVQAAGRVTGVQASTTAGPLQVYSQVVIGCDGRSSTVRAAAGLAVQDLGAPIDVLWFRLSKKSTDPLQVLGHLEPGKMLVTIDRNDYWQCAYVIAKGSAERVRAAGLEAFRRAVAEGAAFLVDRVQELSSFDDIKLLSVSLDRLQVWSRPGLLCIGDAAHAMSPVGGVGINLAIQDAVAAANLLAAKLRAGTVTNRDLAAVQKRRMFAVKVIQRGQVTIHNRVLRPLVSAGSQSLEAPWVVKLLDRSAWLRRWPAQIVGVGVRPEHVRSPEEVHG
jgi:2-polyprenyl-6-methoxyphenol hydroxylase-like FAD-dependent oxidoreductase